MPLKNSNNNKARAKQITESGGMMISGQMNHIYAYICNVSLCDRLTLLFRFAAKSIHLDINTYSNSLMVLLCKKYDIFSGRQNIFSFNNKIDMQRDRFCSTSIYNMSRFCFQYSKKINSIERNGSIVCCVLLMPVSVRQRLHFNFQLKKSL